MTTTGPCSVSAMLCVAVISVTLAAEKQAAPIEHRKAISLARPAVVEVRAAPTAWFRIDSGEGKEPYGPYRVRDVGTGVIVHPDGFVITNADLVTPSSDTPDRLLDLFFQHMLKLYERDAGRGFTDQERSLVIEGLQKKGPITMVDSEGGLIGGVDEIPVQVSVGPTLDSHDGWGHPAELRWMSPADRKGIAILKINGSDLPAARLGDSLELRLQSPFTVLGYSPDVTSAGHIVSYETWKDGSSVMGTDTEGPCEGPAINERGEVVGMIASSPFETHAPGFPLVFLRPINDIKELLRASGIEPEPGRHDALYLEAMEDFWAAIAADESGRIGVARKEYRNAATLFREMLTESPAHVEAHRHLEWAEERLDRLPRGIGEGFLLGAGAALAFAALGIAVAALLWIRRVR